MRYAYADLIAYELTITYEISIQGLKTYRVVVESIESNK